MSGKQPELKLSLALLEYFSKLVRDSFYLEGTHICVPYLIDKLHGRIDKLISIVQRGCLGYPQSSYKGFPQDARSKMKDL